MPHSTIARQSALTVSPPLSLFRLDCRFRPVEIGDLVRLNASALGGIVVALPPGGGVVFSVSSATNHTRLGELHVDSLASVRRVGGPTPKGVARD